MNPSNHKTATEPTPFERFRDLTRRILTTPKAELMKNAPQKAAKGGKAKRGRK